LLNPLQLFNVNVISFDIQFSVTLSYVFIN